MKENSIVEDRLNIYQIGYYLDCKNHIRGMGCAIFVIMLPASFRSPLFLLLLHVQSQEWDTAARAMTSARNLINSFPSAFPQITYS